VGASGLYPARDHWYCYTSNRLDTVRTGSCSGGIVSSLGYDVQGNITSKGGQSFGFDYGNRLRNSGGVSQYLYDGHGRRVRYTGTGVTPYLYSQYDQTGKLRWQRDEQTNQRIRYIYLGNRLVAEHRKPIGINTPTIEYLHADALGSPIARTDAAKAIIETSEYEPYGRLVNRANDDKPGYTGHVQDAATGLTYMQQRYYDPMLGVFLSVDPVTAYSNPVGSFNRYKYAANNPYRFLDPDGRYESPAWMRATIPGQATWDHAVTSFQAGNYGQAAVQGVVAIAEGTAGIMTLGQAQAGASAGRVAFQEVAAINAGKQGAVESAETLSKVNPKTLLGRQGRDEMSGSQVKRLVSDMKANGFDASKPVDIANVGGKKVIIDGHHRTEAAIKAGIQEIPARTVPVTEQQGAQLMQEAAEVRRLRGN
jgi:RHS repeat-associated protein